MHQVTYEPKCAKCQANKATWIRLRMKPHTPYYLCNTCYQNKFPAGQSDVYVAYPRRSDAHEKV